MARTKKEKKEEEYDDLEKFFMSELNSQKLDDVEEFISTGSTLLDFAIANKEEGGVPVGRISEVCGNEASGKSLLCYHILANTQKRGGIAIYIDTERSGNKEFMTRMGVNWDKLIYVRDLACIEDVFDFIEKVAKTTREKIPDKSRPVVIVWDSVAGTPPKKLMEANYDDTTIGLAARAMSSGLNKVKIALDEGWITLIATNQIRMKIGAMFSDPEVTPHGKALPFYSSVRIKLSGTQKLFNNPAKERAIGVNCKARVFKNKVGPNWRDARFPLMYDYGVNDAQSIYDFICDKGLAKGKGWKTLAIGEEEYKFQAATWRETYKKPEVKKFVDDFVREQMIIKFEGMPDKFDIDTESALEIEQLKSDLEG